LQGALEFPWLKYLEFLLFFIEASAPGLIILFVLYYDGKAKVANTTKILVIAFKKF
jgi:hypothetical protein